MRKFWIGTNTAVPGFAISLEESEVHPKDKLFFKLRECSKLEYYLFTKLRINLKADDRFFWFRLFLKEKIYGS